MAELAVKNVTTSRTGHSSSSHTHRHPAEVEQGPGVRGGWDIVWATQPVQSPDLENTRVYSIFRFGLGVNPACYVRPVPVPLFPKMLDIVDYTLRSFSVTHVPNFFRF